MSENSFKLLVVLAITTALGLLLTFDVVIALASNDDMVVNLGSLETYQTIEDRIEEQLDEQLDYLEENDTNNTVIGITPANKSAVVVVLPSTS